MNIPYMAASGIQRFFSLYIQSYNLQFFTMPIDCNFRFDNCIKYIKHTFIKMYMSAHCVTKASFDVTGGCVSVSRGEFKFDFQITLKRK